MAQGRVSPVIPFEALYKAIAKEPALMQFIECSTVLALSPAPAVQPTTRDRRWY